MLHLSSHCESTVSLAIYISLFVTLPTVINIHPLRGGTGAKDNNRIDNIGLHHILSTYKAHKTQTKNVIIYEISCLRLRGVGEGK